MLTCFFTWANVFLIILTARALFSPSYAMELDLSDDPARTERAVTNTTEDIQKERESRRKSEGFSLPFSDALKTEIRAAVVLSKGFFVENERLQKFRQAALLAMSEMQIRAEEEMLSTEEGVLASRSHLGVEDFFGGMELFRAGRVEESIPFFVKAARNHVSLVYPALILYYFFHNPLDPSGRSGFTFLEKAKNIKTLRPTVLVLGFWKALELRKWTLASEYADNLIREGGDYGVYGKICKGRCIFCSPASTDEQYQEGWRLFMQTSNEVVSQFYLGEATKRGKGTRKDERQAHGWYAQVISTVVDTKRFGSSLAEEYGREIAVFKEAARKRLSM